MTVSRPRVLQSGDDIRPFYYPEVVGVLSVLASPRWRRLAISDDPAEQERFYLQVANNGLTNGTPALNNPLRSWVQGHREHRTVDDPDGELHMNRWYFRRSGVVEPPEPEGDYGVEEAADSRYR
jgi:hypothetical protein